MKKILAVILASVFIAACGGPKGFSLKMQGADVPFEQKTNVAVMRPDIKETAFLLANYEVSLPDKSIRGVQNPKTPGQVMVSFAVIGDGKDFNKPLQLGDYTNKTIGWVDVRRGDKGDSTPLSNDDYTFNGKITITEITDDTVKGTIDITKGDNSVKGPFETKIISKKL